MSKIRVDEIVDEEGTGKPDFPNGIQVNGTSIVDENRQLINITSIDATSVAALGAAGVGSGTEVTYPALEAISTGDVISINDAGEASLATPTEGFAFNDEINTTTMGFSFINQVRHMPYLGNGNVYAILGSSPSNTSGVIRFIEFNSDGTYAVKGTSAISLPNSSQTANYSRDWALAEDGQGNFAVGCVFFRTGSIQKVMYHTFSMDDNFAVSSISSGVVLSDGSNYYGDNINIAAYDTNKFMMIYHDASDNLKYRNFSRNGSSTPTLLASGSFGPSAQASVTKMYGYLDDYVDTNQIVVCGFADAGNATFNTSGGATDDRAYATVVTLNSNSPSIGTVVNGIRDHGSDGDGVSSIMHGSQRMKDGYIWCSRVYQGALFRKASASATTLTLVKEYNTNGIPTPVRSGIQEGRHLFGSYAGFNMYSLDAGLYNKNSENIGGSVGFVSANGTYYSRGHFDASENKLYALKVNTNGTTIDQYVLNVGNIFHLRGVAIDSADVGEQVGLAVNGQTVSGYSGLTIGSDVGLNSDFSDVVDNGSTRIGVAVTPTTVLINQIQ